MLNDQQPARPRASGFLMENTKEENLTFLQVLKG